MLILSNFLFIKDFEKILSVTSILKLFIACSAAVFEGSTPKTLTPFFLHSCKNSPVPQPISK